MNESDHTLKLKHLLTLKGFYAVKISGSMYGSAGTPDILACYNGTFYGLESKMITNKSGYTGRQVANLLQIKTAGGVALGIIIKPGSTTAWGIDEKFRYLAKPELVTWYKSLGQLVNELIKRSRVL